MNAMILNIGNELLIGQVINTNASYISKQLNSHGIQVNKIEVVGDDKKEILSALNEGQNFDLVIITGGLGPTKDDITKHSLAEFMDDILTENKLVLKDIEALLKKRGRQMNILNQQQALVLSQCRVIRNFVGTAPGMIMKKNNTFYVSLPGVPFEMKPMMKEIINVLSKEYVLNRILHKTLLVFGIPESELALKLEEWETQLQDSDIQLAYLPNRNFIRLRLSAYNANEDIENKIAFYTHQLKLILNKHLIGEEVFAQNDDNPIAASLVNLLKEKGLTISFAESCTGGSIASIITKIPGASDVFLGGIVSYDNAVKKKMLNVREQTLTQYGAVSKECVEEMVMGLKNLLKTNITLSVSGIAGPTGGTADKPVGTVWMSLYFDDKIETKLFEFGEHSREYIIDSAVFNALAWILKKLIHL